jgi:hypothetical protein
MRSPLLLLIVAPLAATVLLVGCNGMPTGPSDLFQLALSSPTVVAGTTSAGTITLRGRMPHPVRVDLSSSDAVASVPASILVPAGTAVAEFTVRTRLVAADTMARITATAGDVREEIALQVVAPIARPATLDALDLQSASVRGGQDVQGTVRLTGAAPAGGVSVGLRSSNTAAVLPATVLIPSGALSAAFTISTRPVTLDTQLEITASYLDQARTLPLRVLR